MSKKNVKRKNVSLVSGIFGKIGKFIVLVIKAPYFLFRLIRNAGSTVKKKQVIKKIKEQRESLKPAYEDFSRIHTYAGDFKKWEKTIFKTESKIGIILGARGKGKSAIGMKILENYYFETHKKCYAVGFHNDDLPSWITAVEDISEIKNNGFVLIDEGGILFSSRKSMTAANKFLSDLILVARHKNLSILFISQNCLPLTEKILTPEGFKTLEELKTNDIIKAFDFENNRLVSAPSIKSPTISKKIVKIHLEDGRILRSSKDHRWIVYDKNGLSQIKAADLNKSKHYLVDVSSND